MSEVREPCGKCGHSLASHARDIHSRPDVLTIDPALLQPKPIDIYSGRPAGESGCTECDCRRWEPTSRGAAQ
jgi:hypothetical protein